MSHRISPLRLLLTALLAGLVTLALGASSALAADATFKVSWTKAGTNYDVTLTTTGTNDPSATYVWTVDGNPAGTSSSVTVPGLSHSQHAASLTVTDPLGAGGATDTKQAPFTPDTAPTIPNIAGPPTATVGQAVVFTASASDPDGDPLSYFWYDNECAEHQAGVTPTGPTLTCTFTTAGPHGVSVGADDGLGGTSPGAASVQVTAPNQLPVADFSFTPTAPRTGEPIALSSTASDPDGSIASYAWDYDNDGTVDATSASPTARFTTPGNHAVKLTVTDNLGASVVVLHNIPVGQPPTASFTISPAAPTAGSPVTFTATSSDANGFITTNNWDLDGNGTFGDAQGSLAQRAYLLPGFYTVSLQSVDNEGIADIASQTFAVGPASAATQPGITNVPTKTTPVVTRLIATVAFAGKKLRQGVWLSNMTVSGPRNATVSATCHGKGCPRRIKSFLVGRRGKARVKALERRTLRVGVRIVIRVTRYGSFGKYTRVSVIKRKGFGDVQRKDSCVYKSRVHSCPVTTGT